MKKRVLMMTHPGFLPPDGMTKKEAKDTEFMTAYDVLATLKKLKWEVMELGVEGDLTKISKAIAEFKPHLAFNLLEEFDGEATYDQNVVSYLELKKVPYTGNSPRGLMLARDKALSKKILHYHRIPVPRFQVFPKNRKTKRKKSLPFPLIVKSLTEEASLGISQASVVTTESQLAERVAFIHESIASDAIVEEFIEGRELYVGILGNKRLQVFPPWELLFKKPKPQMVEIATGRVKHSPKYRQKHRITSDLAKDLSDETLEKIKKVAKRVFRVLDQSGYSRIDIRLSADGIPYVLEANPNPDIAELEDFSMGAYYADIEYDELLKRIMSLGRGRR